MTRIFLALVFTVLAAQAQAFCGFYTAKADGSLFNQSSKVVFVRDGQRSAITMSSDHRGGPADFAQVVPTPRVLLRGQIRTVAAETVQRLDDDTAPRLVEYFDRDPCAPVITPGISFDAVMNQAAPPASAPARALGVTIESEYAVGTHDILILGAEQSDGLVTFLTGESYALPEGAEGTLQDYIEGGMKFFVAGVNLDRRAAAETKGLPPLGDAELADLGVDWLPEGGGTGPGAGQNVYVTRLHARHEGDQMPEDVIFRATGDRQNFQGDTS